MTKPDGLSWRVDTISEDGRSEQIEVFIAAPAIEPERPECWTCRFGWRGGQPLERLSFGATSLQAVEMAIPLLTVSLENAFPDADLLEDGSPFLLRAAR